ncbi:hypothetical protein Tco_0709629 [Tanacetum coccineum]
MLVDGKQDDAKLVRVVGVVGHQISNEPNVLKGSGVISVEVNKNNKGDDKEVQYSVYTLHVLIMLLKRLNDKYIKKKKMDAAIQRRLWDPGIKSVFQDNTLRASDRNAEYELSKLLQMGTVAEYQDEFEKLINRVTGISESLLTSFYISGLKLTLSIELLRARPTTLGEAFSLARIIEARLEAIAEKEKEQIIKKKADTILSLRSELASPEIKGSLDADEDIGIDEVSSAIDCVFHIGESNEVRSKFGEFSENKKSVIEVVMGGGEALGVYREKSRGAAEGGRRVLCYVQGSKRLKKKKMEAAIQRRLWDPGIKSAFQDNTLRARWF